MNITIKRIIVRGTKGKERDWIEPGTYKIVREFDKKRWLINVGGSRGLTIVHKYMGIVGH